MSLNAVKLFLNIEELVKREIFSTLQYLSDREITTTTTKCIFLSIL